MNKKMVSITDIRDRDMTINSMETQEEQNNLKKIIDEPESE